MKVCIEGFKIFSICIESLEQLTKQLLYQLSYASLYWENLKPSISFPRSGINLGINRCGRHENTGTRPKSQASPSSLSTI